MGPPKNLRGLIPLPGAPLRSVVEVAPQEPVDQPEGDEIVVRVSLQSTGPDSAVVVEDVPPKNPPSPPLGDLPPPIFVEQPILDLEQPVAEPEAEKDALVGEVGVGVPSTAA